MKRSELTISVLLVPLDYAALLAAAALAYAIRYAGLADNLRTTTVIPLAEYLRIAALIAVGWVAIFALAGCYATGARRRWSREFGRIILASSTGFAFVLAVIVFSREFFASRFIVLASWPLAICTVLLVRFIVRIVERALFAAGVGVHRLALIGTGAAADALAAAFGARPSLGFRVVQRYDQFDDRARSAIAAAWRDRAVDEAVDVRTPPDAREIHQLLDFAAEQHLPVRYSADFLAARAPRIHIETFAGVPLIEVHRTRLLGWGRVFKRAFDLVVATILLVITAPLMLCIALAVRLDSPGPILFRQRRIGAAGRPFDFLKFRSMRVGAHAEWAKLREQSDREGPVPKIKDDPRVTRVGRWLRRWSLDELPQLFTVLAGTMSLIGPRPHLPEEVADYAAHHKAVLAVAPGITGLAQVSGRADLHFEDEVRLDTYYVENWSPALDLVILLRTPFAVARTRGAY